MLLAECASASESRATFEPRAFLKGRDELDNPSTLTILAKELSADADCLALGDLAPGELVLLIAREAAANVDAELSWKALAVDETSYAYVAQSPGLDVDANDRLAYFAKYLEHADPLIAGDAYFEFGHAPFDKVQQAAACLPMDKIRGWVRDPGIPDERKGFYGLALGLATDAANRAANLGVLRQCVDSPAADFRAGFDGILGGWLLAAGEPGLEYLEKKLLANPEAAEGDVRHALTALRFYREYGRALPAERLASAARLLLQRPGFAPEVIADLARWQSWDSREAVVGCFDRQGTGDPLVDRAVVGFLKVCPAPEAKASLARLRKELPERILAAEKKLSPARPNDR